jgi:large subunit ribosomal protein L13
MRRTKESLQQTVWIHPDDIKKDQQWWIVDAAGLTLGRLAVEIAKKLQGKHKAHYCDMWDCGDFVVVLNADKVKVTGNKASQKIYYKHTGYKGHLREINFEDLQKKHPERVFEYALR